MPTVFITGANRGLGLEFARQYAADGWRVLAACRDPEGAHDLKRIEGDIEVLRLDVTSDDEIAALQSGLADEIIDVLINNAGIWGIGGGGAGQGSAATRTWSKSRAARLRGNSSRASASIVAA